VRERVGEGDVEQERQCARGSGREMMCEEGGGEQERQCVRGMGKETVCEEGDGEQRGRA